VRLHEDQRRKPISLLFRRVDCIQFKNVIAANLKLCRRHDELLRRHPDPMAPFEIPVVAHAAPVRMSSTVHRRNRISLESWEK